MAPSRLTSVLFGLMAWALVCRAWGTATAGPRWLLIAPVLELTAFVAFGGWLWRALSPPSLALTRSHLMLATGWFGAALGLEAVLRWRALGADGGGPDLAGMRAVHTMAILGGVAGWILGVALRAAPMFVAGWHVPERLASAAPVTLALGVLVAAGAELAGAGSAGVALGHLGQFLVLGTISAVALTGGALRVRRARVPMMPGRSGPELAFFRVAMLSAVAAALGSAVAAAAASRGVPLSLAADALRHLVTVGFLTSIVLAMGFRLLPVFEGAPLRWPGLRPLAVGALLAAVLLRSAEVLADYGWEAILPWLPLSGVLVWVALACLAGNLVGILGSRWGDRASPASRV